MSAVQHVLLVNGWSANRYLWDSFFQSGLPQFSYDVMDLDTVASLESLHEQLASRILPSTLLVGWSLGAEIALSLLCRNNVSSTFKKPLSQVQGFVALQFTPCFVEKSDWEYGMASEQFESIRSLCLAGDRDDLVRRFSHLLVRGSHHLRQDMKALKDIYNSDLIFDMPVLLSGLEMLEEIDLRKRLLTLTVPTLCVLGEGDALVNPISRQFLACCPGVQVELLPGMGHLPCLSHAVQVSRIIAEFVNRL